MSQFIGIVFVLAPDDLFFDVGADVGDFEAKAFGEAAEDVEAVLSGEGDDCLGVVFFVLVLHYSAYVFYLYWLL